MGRLYSSTFYAMRDTKTPLRYAVVRVVLTTVLGYLFALVLPPWLGLDRKLGAAGLTASAGLAGWVEFYLLRREMDKRIGRTRLVPARMVRLWGAALAGAAIMLTGWPLFFLGRRLSLGSRAHAPGSRVHTRNPD